MEDLPKSFHQIREAKSALYRITDFLLSQEINDNYITRFRTIESIEFCSNLINFLFLFLSKGSTHKLSQILIQIENATFGWTNLFPNLKK